VSVSLPRQLFRRRFRVPSGRERGPVTVVLAEDTPGHVELYGGLLHNNPEAVELVGVATDPLEVEDCVSRYQPQVLLLDHLFDESPHPEITGLSLVPQLRKRWPKLGIILLTGIRSPQLVHEFFIAAKGAGRAFLLKAEDDKHDLLRHIQAVAEGYDYVTESLQKKYEDYTKFIGLDTEDKAILELLAQGLTYEAVGRRVAERIGYPLSVRAITERVRRMADKLDIPRETEDGDRVERLFLLQKRYLASCRPDDN
jgi:DNA-binding NarL/FixJ family response regulator